MLTYIQGDLFTTDQDVISHSVNCSGGFGSGIAGQISRIYPEVRRAYINKFNQDGWHLGEIQLVPLWRPKTNTHIIVNMATQERYGRTGKFVDYVAVKQCLSLLMRYCEMHNLSVAIPKIGAGLGGGDWAEIEPLLVESVNTSGVNVKVYSLQ